MKARSFFSIARDVMRACSSSRRSSSLRFSDRRRVRRRVRSSRCSRWIDYESGAKTLQRLPDLARTVAVIAKKLRGKIFERIAHLTPDDSLGIDVDHRRQHFRYGQNRRLRGGIGLRENELRREEKGHARSTTTARLWFILILPLQVTEHSSHCQLAVTPSMSADSTDMQFLACDAGRSSISSTKIIAAGRRIRSQSIPAGRLL